MMGFFFLSYSVFVSMLGLDNRNLSISFFFANLPFVTTITMFIALSMSLRTRFVFINDIFDQMRLDASSTSENVHVYDRKQSDGNIFVIKQVPATPCYIDNRSIFQRLNDLLVSRSVMKEIKIKKMVSNAELKQYIDRLIHMHSKLCNCITFINALTSFKLFLSLIYMFVFVVFACFTGYR